MHFMEEWRAGRQGAGDAGNAGPEARPGAAAPPGGALKSLSIIKLNLKLYRMLTTNHIKQ